MDVEEFLKFLDECGADVDFATRQATWRVSTITGSLRAGIRFLFLNDGLVIGIVWVGYNWKDDVEDSGNVVLYLPKSESDRVDDVVKFVVPMPKKCHGGS